MRTRHLLSVALVGSWLVAGCGGLSKRNCPNDNCTTSCPNDSYLAGGTCIPFTVCEPGSYLVEAGTATSDQVCASCLSGTFASTENAPACSPWRTCQPGDYVTNMPSATTDRNCAACGAGTYTKGINESACLSATACPAGTIETVPASATSPQKCTPCSTGQYCAGGKAAAVECAGDKWDDDRDPATTCVAKTVCKAGTYVVDAGSGTFDRTCRSCPSGFFSLTDNVDLCAPWATCPIGTYVTNTPGATTDRQCLECPTDTYTSGENQAVCLSATDCPAGTTLTAPGTMTSGPQCDPCDKGQYCPGGDTPARACGDGTWDHDGNPATPCARWSLCMPGSYVSMAGSATLDVGCMACPDQTFSDSGNAPECTPWTDCWLGTYVGSPGTVQSDRVCISCSYGTFTAETNQSSCSDWSSCLPNISYVSQAGTLWSDVQCSACSMAGCAQYCTMDGTCVECLSYVDCTPGLWCAGGSCKTLDCSQKAYFVETFLSGNAQWWKLEGDWDIGQAKPWSGDGPASETFPDPEDDATGAGDKMMAGVVIGGPVPATVMTAPAYLTSGAIDISQGPSPVYLEFSSYLNSPTSIMNSVEVWNGSEWVRLWLGPSTPESDDAWHTDWYDITPYRNDAFRVRFGYQVTDAEAVGFGGWNIDNVTVTNVLGCLK